MRVSNTGHREVVELLLKAKATANLRPKNFSRSSLHVAMNKGKSFGNSFTGIHISGAIRAHFSVRKIFLDAGHRNVVEAILEYHAVKDGKALDHMTHLHYAATCGII